MTFGELFKALREGKGFSQDKMAEYISRIMPFSQSRVSNTERDVSIPDFFEVCKIGIIFNLRPAEIWEKIKDDPLYDKKYKIPIKLDCNEQ